ncbi:MAG: GTPase ObgE [Mycoplasmataceae bacterium]|nr:GTPase ObgE [Mycoplasmataceae bacterium]
MQLVDECIINLKAGNGGNGIVSWRREANVPMGGPYGGNGGDGGNIILVGDHNVNTLFEWRNHKSIVAPNGENGRTAKETGRRGEDIYINLPLGTSIYDLNTNELLVDLLESGQTFTICEGGKGGRGNAFFKSSFNRAPTLHENGDLGEEKIVILKLKYVADVGLVGLPNAGKSTLIGKISNVKSKIGNYQFTTLIPILGTIQVNNAKMVIADLPGLIEGAAAGKGLGHEFLKHIERCSILIHLISLNPQDNDDIVHSYNIINNELRKYSKALLAKPIILAANKSDINGTQENILKLKKIIKNKLHVISALNNSGVKELIDETYQMFLKIQDENKIKLLNKTAKTKIIELKQQKDFTKDLKIIQVQKDKWQVESEYMRYWTNKIPLDTKDNIVRYNQKMQTIKVETTAKNIGAKPGDTLLIYGNEFTIDK